MTDQDTLIRGLGPAPPLAPAVRQRLFVRDWMTAPVKVMHVDTPVLDAYNLLARKYADDAEYYVSNWSTKPGQQPASEAAGQPEVSAPGEAA